MPAAGACHKAWQRAIVGRFARVPSPSRLAGWQQRAPRLCQSARLEKESKKEKARWPCVCVASLRRATLHALRPPERGRRSASAEERLQGEPPSWANVSRGRAPKRERARSRPASLPHCPCVMWHPWRRSLFSARTARCRRRRRLLPPRGPPMRTDIASRSHEVSGRDRGSDPRARPGSSAHDASRAACVAFPGSTDESLRSPDSGYLESPRRLRN